MQTSACQENSLHTEIKHGYYRKAPDRLKSNLGKYYTPPHIVEKLAEIVSPYVKRDSIILDPACGCGAFLDAFPENRVIGRDIDPEVVQILKEAGYTGVDNDNSLANVTRTKYNLKGNDPLVIVGNPPYNDTTSLNKKHGTNAKDAYLHNIDNAVNSNDIGISFLKSFALLEADVVCILHPLSYLIKETNFNTKLAPFVKHYRLERGVFFSSAEFPDTQGTPFPIVIALYIRSPGGMDYDEVRDFRFELIDQTGSLILSRIETIDGFIRKYPLPRNTPDRRSNIGLYMHSIRDVNSLITRGYLTQKEDFANNITINFAELPKYAYLNCCRRYFRKDYRFGNLSPLIDRKRFESDETFRDLCVIDTIVNNPNIAAFDPRNPESILHSKGLLERYREKSGATKPDYYRLFVEYCEELATELKPLLAEYFTGYFEKLKKRSIFHK